MRLLTLFMLPALVISARAAESLSFDRGTAALIPDLKNRDLLKDTLIIWGGELSLIHI